MRYLSTTDVQGKKILLRLDLDLPPEGKSFDTTRMEDGFATVEYLWKHKASGVTVIAHRGKPAKGNKPQSLAPIAELFYKTILKQKTFAKVDRKQLEEWLEIRENLRLDPREEKGDSKFGKELAKGHDLFVNDAFATSHRSHTSIVIIPKYITTVFGIQFEKEMTVMKKITETPKRPFIFVLGGAKLETKLPLLEKVSENVDVILLGGKLAAEAKKQGYKNRKMIIADLTEDGLDITQASMEQFERFIVEAKTLVWNGPMGRFEDGKHMAGTQFIANAIVKGSGYKVIGGGDTEAALTQLKMSDNKAFTHISSGGGAMLHYLTYRSLPAIEAVENVGK
jgi:phosphoglycerate kinase